MPFDPTIPQDHALIEAAPLRDQFNSLKTLVDDRVTPEQMLEARNDAISAAEASSARNCNQVLPLSMNADPEYNANQIQEMILKLNELLNALQR